MNLKQFDTVVLIQPFFNKNLRIGSLGTIVEILEKDIFLVEFADKNGVAYAIEALQAKQLLKVYEEPVSV